MKSVGGDLGTLVEEGDTGGKIGIGTMPETTLL